MKVFRVSGWFRSGISRQRFTLELPAVAETSVLERVYSEVGSRHKVKRNQIHIVKVTEIKPEDRGMFLSE